MTTAFHFLIAISLLITIKAQQLQPPQRYIYESSKAWSVNGSSPVANCNATYTNGDGTVSTCVRPWTSILFDRNIPVLTELDGDSWASELLTLDLLSTAATMTFDFNCNPYSCPYFVARIEVLLFNCPRLGTSIREIRLIDSVSRYILGFYYPTTTSCDSLVRVCIPYSTTRRILTLQFIPEVGSHWLHLAEIEFHCIGFFCPQPTTSMPSTTSEITVSTTLPIAGPTDEFTPAPVIPTIQTTIDSANNLTSEGTALGDSTSHSCFTSNVVTATITAVTTGLLATAIFALVLIPVCRKQQKLMRAKADESKTKEPIYEDMDGVEKNISFDSKKIGEGGKVNQLEMTNNNAYFLSYKK